ncbi:MAG TPA: hypothetical protein VNA32_06660 [Actinomycetota bacterium]|nr:hypothetical protein [Actinomycetota bacterium]
MAGKDVASTDDEIVLRLAAKPGARFDADEISACLDYTVSKIKRAKPSNPVTREDLGLVAPVRLSRAAGNPSREVD